VRRFAPALVPMLLLLNGSVAQAASRQVVGELVPNATAIEAGRPLIVGLHLVVAPGMHVYWSNPGDGGGPIRLEWTLPPGFTAGPLRFPVPDRIPQPGNLMVYGYENEVLLQTIITPPAHLNAGNVHLAALGQWVVCSTEQCYFGKANLTLDLPVAAPKPANASLFAAWAPRMPRSSADAFSSVDVNWNAASNEARLAFHWKNPATAPANIHWLPDSDDATTTVEEQISSLSNITTMKLSIQPVAGIPQKQTSISGVLSYHEDGQAPRGVAVTFDRKTMRLIDAAAN